MKKLVLIILSVITVNVFGNNSHPLRDTLPCRDADSMQVVIRTLQQQHKDLEMLRGFVKQQTQEIETLSVSNGRLFSSMDALSKEIDTLKKNNERQECVQRAAKQETAVRFLRFQNNVNHIIVAVLIACVLIGIVFFVLFRKTRKEKINIQILQSDYNKLRSTCTNIQDDTIKLVNLLVQQMEMKADTERLGADSRQGSHELVLKIADEIVRIGTNLSHMDSSVKGYKQLGRAVERIKANFLANGYEIVDMLGKPYNEGMKVTANFVTDDTLAEGEQIITGIIKPQINYCGKMIQAAQITVNQNL